MFHPDRNKYALNRKKRKRRTNPKRRTKRNYAWEDFTPKVGELYFSPTAIPRIYLGECGPIHPSMSGVKILNWRVLSDMEYSEYRRECEENKRPVPKSLFASSD